MQRVNVDGEPHWWNPSVGVDPACHLVSHRMSRVLDAASRTRASSTNEGGGAAGVRSS